MKRVKTCPYCEGTTDLPHPSDADCLRAVDREIQAAVSHMRTLTSRKSNLLRVRMQHRHRTMVARRRARL